MTHYGKIDQMYDESNRGTTTIPYTGHPEDFRDFDDLLKINPFGTQRIPLQFEPEQTRDNTLVDIKNYYVDDTFKIEYLDGIRSLREELLRRDTKAKIGRLIEETLADLEDVTEKNLYGVRTEKPFYEVTDDMVLEEIIPATTESVRYDAKSYLLVPLREGEVGDVPYALVESEESNYFEELSLDDIVFVEENDTQKIRPIPEVIRPAGEVYRPIPTIIGPVGYVRPVEIKYGNDTKNYAEDKLVKITPADLKHINSAIGDIGDIVDMDMPTLKISRPLLNEKVPLWKRILDSGTKYTKSKK